MPFGGRDSDFVFREPAGEYLLVEIERPSRRLFRKDGQQHEELTHAVNQVLDWYRYIEDNVDTVRRELKLDGIGIRPDALVVLGRSSMLDEENRRKLQTLRNHHPTIRIELLFE